MKKKIVLHESTIKLAIVSVLGIVLLGVITLLSVSYYYSHKKSSVLNRLPVIENTFESNPSEFEKNQGNPTDSQFKPIEGNPDEIFDKPSEVPVGTK